MIRLENISKSYADRVLFDDISFTVHKNEKIALVGRNGSGKTTLFRLITKQETSDTGNIIFPKDYSIGYLDQHLKFTKDTILEEAILSLPIEEKDHIYKVEKVLFGLGFQKEDLNRSPSEFSGGYQLRLHLSKVLIKEHNLLLLDEPTNYLDIISINWFKRFLKSYKGEFIIISHDRDFLDSVCNSSIALHRNEIIKTSGDTKKLFELILEKETLYEKTKANLDKKREHLQKFITRFKAKASKAAQAKSKQKSLDKLSPLEELTHLGNLNFNFHYDPIQSKKMVDLKDLYFSYEDKKNLIHDLSFTIENKQRVAIIGKNGFGKSTILKLLAKELKPNKGDVIFNDKVSIGYFGQTNINRLHSDMTIEDEILSSNSNLSIGQIRSIAALMMFTKDNALKKIKVLSGGEKSRVLIGKIIAKPCNLLILDEPTNHLDMESIEALLDAIENFKGACIIVTHSEYILSKLKLDKIIICEKDKQKYFLGSYLDFLSNVGFEEEFFTKKNKKNTESKNTKLKKHEIVTQRTNDLKILKTKMDKIEKEIINLEKKIDIENQKLIEASNKEDVSSISKLAKSMSDNNNRLDLLFDELEELNISYENKKVFYKNKLDSL
ncbi:MAG: putative ABC transporter ATP-binding protein YheS [Candidatus Anoxychlamydiales bacterium]|nr:putative ABC transporter ATP-binding protein YheS [Candidatus Anoxychlamydiales bacterium]